MKKIINWMLIIPLMMGLSMNIIACSDDDDDNNTQRLEDADALDTDETRAAWHWITTLSSANSLDDNWNTKTYAPTIGIASENNATTRIIVVADIEEARKSFADIANLSVDELTGEKTINVSGVGKLVWTPSAQGAQNLAEVSVNIKMIPELQKIVYCTSDQVGVNGIFYDNVKGAAYYRFGDVIKDHEGYYWVCVRPSFQINDKGDSHWMNIFNANAEYGGKEMPTENILTKYNKKYNNKTILFPTKLAYSREHLHNLANLLFAIKDPNAYNNVVGQNGNGLGEFPFKYHDKDFCSNVANYWTEEDIWQKLFNLPSLEKYNKLHFFYQGYSWTWGNAVVWIYSQSAYQVKITGSASGDKTEYDVKSTGFDIRRYAGYKEGDYDKTAAHEQFSTNGDAYFVVRYKKGEDLVHNGTYNPYSTIPGCTDVYRYYQKVNVIPGTNLDEAMERDHEVITYNDKPEVGMIVGKSGKIYKNESDCFRNDDQARAMIIYKSDFNDFKNALDSENFYRTTYAIPLDFSKDGNDGNFSWGPKGQRCADPTDVSTLLGGLDELYEKRNGIVMTDTLVKHRHEHEAAMAARNYPKLTYINETTGIEGGEYLNYFLPTIGQWRKVLSGLGYIDAKSVENGEELKKTFDELFRKAGISGNKLELFDGSYIWTSSEVKSDDYNQAFCVRFNTNSGFDFIMEDKDKEHKVIPFIRL